MLSKERPNTQTDKELSLEMHRIISYRRSLKAHPSPPQKPVALRQIMLNTESLNPNPLKD